MYKLIKIKPTGMRVTLADSTDKEALDLAARRYTEMHPEYAYSVVEAA